MAIMMARAHTGNFDFLSLRSVHNYTCTFIKMLLGKYWSSFFVLQVSKRTSSNILRIQSVERARNQSKCDKITRFHFWV